MRPQPSAHDRFTDGEQTQGGAATESSSLGGAGDRPITAPPARSGPDATLLFAQRLLTARRRRSRMLDGLAFGEPDWDILLDAFVAGGNRQVLPVSSLCIVANISVSTALRRINAMIMGGYLRRSRDLVDHRRSLVEITEIGEAKFRRCLEDIMRRLDVAD